jgi:hypothetical protein
MSDLFRRSLGITFLLWCLAGIALATLPDDSLPSMAWRFHFGSAELLIGVSSALCAQLGMVNCNKEDLTWKWLDSVGFCGHLGCHFTQSCPNNVPCPEATKNKTCVFISTYPTIGDLKDFERDGTLNGPGGKSYACSQVAEPKPCVGDPNSECALIY